MVMSVASRFGSVLTIVSILSLFRKRTTFEWGHIHFTARNLVAKASCPRCRSITDLPTRIRVSAHTAVDNIHSHASRSENFSRANSG